MFIEERRAELTELDAASETGHWFGAISPERDITLGRLPQTLQRDLSRDLRVHLDEDEATRAAVGVVQRQHGMAERSCASERVENKGVFIRTDFEYSLHETQRLGRDE